MDELQELLVSETETWKRKAVKQQEEQDEDNPEHGARMH
jgi:hypothetical protein